MNLKQKVAAAASPFGCHPLAKSSGITIGMKVKTNTPDLLIVENRPWSLGLALASFTLGMAAASIAEFADGNIAVGFLLGAIAILICLSMGLFVQRTIVFFDRKNGTVAIRSAKLRGTGTVIHNLENVHSAELQVSDVDGQSVHRIALKLDGGMDIGIHPLTEVYVSGNRTARTTRAINRWLASSLDSDRAPI